MKKSITNRKNGINPRIGEIIQIVPRNVITFKSALFIKQLINSIKKDQI